MQTTLIRGGAMFLPEHDDRVITLLNVSDFSVRNVTKVSSDAQTLTLEFEVTDLGSLNLEAWQYLYIGFLQGVAYKPKAVV